MKSKTTESAFEVIDGEMKPRLTVLATGRTKSGKTWFSLSSPGDIGIISLDTNCKSICHKYHSEHPEKKLHYAEFLRSPLSQLEDINDLKKHWNRVRDAHYAMLKIPSIRTIVWDTVSSFWDDCKLAYVGREKPDLSSEVDKDGKPTGKKFGTQKTMPRDLGEPKRDIREMINACDDKNLVMLAGAKDEWRNDVKTGGIERIAMPGIEYLSQCEIELTREPLTGTFIARMLGSTANADLRGRVGSMSYVQGQGDVWVPSQDELTGEDINFASVGVAVFPFSEYESWT